jgi:circadian clock protein KaiB
MPPIERLPETFKFVLFIAGETPNCMLALRNLVALAEKHLPRRHEIEVVNVFLDPARAIRDGVFLTPMLLTAVPRRLIAAITGLLEDPRPVLAALGVAALAA